jgi:hypothetical protein
VTGANINEGVLPPVPNATASPSADEVDGLGARSFEFRANIDDPPTTVYSQGGLRLIAECKSAHFPRLELTADSALDNSFLHATSVQTVNAFDTVVVDQDFDSGEAPKQLIDDDPLDQLTIGYGLVAFRGNAANGVDTTSDDVVIVEYSYQSFGNCLLMGTGSGGPN